MFFFRADVEKFPNFEDEGWEVLSSRPEGEPLLLPMSTMPEKRLEAILTTFTSIVKIFIPDPADYQRCKTEYVSRLNGTFAGKTIGGEGFTFEAMEGAHEVLKKKPAPPPRENINYGRKRTVDENGNCHAEWGAEDYFTAGAKTKAGKKKDWHA